MGFGVWAGAMQSMNADSRQAKQIAWGGVGAGLRAVAQTARVQGNITLAEALDITRFEVYEGYLDEELDHQQSQAAARRGRWASAGEGLPDNQAKGGEGAVFAVTAWNR